ncbi:MAG: single-stranded DNA-binding protein [Candidatus Cloacimonadia bacterium]
MAKKLNMPNINNVIVSGRLTRDVDLRYTSNGTPVATIGLASDRRYKDADNNWQDETTFLRVVAWSQLAERVAENLKKGSPVLVEGRLRSSQWRDKNDTTRTTIEIVANRIQSLEREIPGETEEEEVTETAEEEDDIPF